jgi:hypothetical protein
MQVRLGDFDFDAQDAFVLKSCRRLDLKPEMLAKFFTGEEVWRTPQFYRRSFCYECFGLHIREYGHPAILKCWSRPCYTICDHHKIPMLDSSSKCGFKLDGAIELFKYYHMNRDHIRTCLVHSCQGRDGTLYLAKKAQAFLLQAEENAAMKLDHRSEATWFFCKLLLEVLLYPRYGFVYQFSGLPLYSGVDSPFRYRLHMGVLTANVIQRRAAIIILGYVMSLYDPGELECMGMYLRDSPISKIYLTGIYDIGRFSNVFVSSQALAILTRLQVCGGIIGKPSIIEFLAGFAKGRK